jgi:D-arginine dehydrogenase
MTLWDVIIVGGGIAGASLAEALAPYQSTVLIEAEEQPGYHATGRSAAFWSVSYGGPKVQPLTLASGPLLAKPASGFHAKSFLKPRGALYIGTDADRVAAEKLKQQFCDSGVSFYDCDALELRQKIPGIAKNLTLGLWEPDCCDIDVAALHGAYLSSARRKGAKIECHQRFQSAAFNAGAWDIETSLCHFRGKLLVNAAGAWADDVAQKSGVQPLDIRPFRRTIAQLLVSPGAPADLPLTIGLDESFYFKPEANGRLWLSPHDETPTLPCDAAPEELDIARAIDRLETVVDWKIKKLEHKWAGLRSFASDRAPVIGRDKDNDQFFWFAGQGGFGIQTAPAAAQLAASLLLEHVSAPAGVSSDAYSPERF